MSNEARSLGRYVIVGEVGRGAMGVVYRAMHPAFGIPVAIKVIADHRSSDPRVRERMQREARVMAGIDHPGIARVYDLDEDGGSLFIVMELVEGQSLRSLLVREGPLPEAAAVKLMLEVLDAVGAAHRRGVIHRDLKPDNVMLTTDGAVKVVDFGLSKMIGDDRHLTAAGVALGTPDYMAPEQLRGHELDGRTDIYALGAVLYELLSGHAPFAGGTGAVIRAQVEDPPPPDALIRPRLMNVIATAMAKDRRDRYQTYVDFALALTAATEDRTDPAPVPAPALKPTAHVPVAGRPARRRPARWGRLPGVAVLTTTAATMLIVITAVTAVTFSDPDAGSGMFLAAVRAYLVAWGGGNAAQVWQSVTVDQSALPPGLPRAVGMDELAAMLQLPDNRQPVPTSVALAGASVSGTEAVVNVRYAAAGATHQLALRLARVGGDWRVRLAPGAITLSAVPALPAAEVRIDGRPVPAGTGALVAVLPGAHLVEVAAPPPFVAAPVEVRVTDPYPAAVAAPVSVGVTPAALGAAGTTVRAALTACAASTAAAPAGCPQSVAAPAGEPVHWTVVGDPAAALAVGVDASGAAVARGTFGMIGAYAVHLPDDTRHLPSAGRFTAPLRWTGTGWTPAGAVARDAAPNPMPAVAPDLLLAAVSDGFRACAGSRLLRPADCPQSVPSSLFVSSVAWALDGDPVAGAVTGFDAARDVLTVSGRYAMSCSYVEGGEPKRADSAGAYRADLLWDGTRPVLVDIAAA